MCTREALALKKHKKYIKFVWIPAHMSNVTADVSGRESIQKGEDAQYLIPVTGLKSYWKSKLRVAAEEWYRESGKQKGRKEVLCELLPKEWKTLVPKIQV
jgi:hypothetical protein